MKKMTLLRSIAAVALFTVVGMGASAQIVTTPSNTGGYTALDSLTSDYVTTGSRVSYYVKPDQTLLSLATAGKMKQSVFQWNITDNGGTALANPILNFAGTAASQWDAFRVAGTGFYDNEISLLWNNALTSGTSAYKVKVNEQSVTLSSTVAGCLGNQTLLDVYVLAHPTAAFNGTEGGGCSIAPGASYYVPLSVTGLGTWTVSYTVSYNGGAAGATQTYNLPAANVVVTDANVVSESTTARAQDGTPTAATNGLKIDLPLAQYGYYDIAITDINDRISKKALATGSSLVAAPAAGSYRIYVNPTPKTNSINHIKNL